MTIDFNSAHRTNTPRLEALLCDAGLHLDDLPPDVSENIRQAAHRGLFDLAYNLLAAHIGERLLLVEADRTRLRRIREDQQAFRKARRKHTVRPRWARHAR